MSCNGLIGRAIIYGQVFCLAHPNCSFSWDNQTYACNGDQSSLHWK